MRFIVQTVFPGTGALSNIEIIVRQIDAALADTRQQLAVAVERGIETGFKHLFGLGRRRLELQDLERTELWNQGKEKRKKTLARTWLAIVLAPFAFII